MAGISGGIFAVTFIFCTILPQVTSTFFGPLNFLNGIPGLGNGFNNPNQRFIGGQGFGGSSGFRQQHRHNHRWDKNFNNNNINKAQPEQTPGVPVPPVVQVPVSPPPAVPANPPPTKANPGPTPPVAPPVPPKANPGPTPPVAPPVPPKANPGPTPPVAPPVPPKANPGPTPPVAPPVPPKVNPGPTPPVAPPVPPKVNPGTTVKKGLQMGFYQQTCPQAEKIIQDTMLKIFNKDVKLAPALVRLFFHDCFVTGCDASIMLDKTPSGENVEKTASQNGNFVRGFNELEEVKKALEAACPGIVSCADIIAFANREALNQTGVPRYNLAAGRRDRNVSLAKNCRGNLPFPDTSVDESLRMFTSKGMTLDDLVLLTGAHSIGEAHCTIVANRLTDPVKRKDISPRYLDQLNVQLTCQDKSQTLPFDRQSSNILDVGYYTQLLNKETLIESDANLAKDPRGGNIMRKLQNDQNGFMSKFVQSIIKLGEVEVLTGDQGEIRKQCNAFN